MDSICNNHRKLWRPLLLAVGMMTAFAGFADMPLNRDIVAIDQVGPQNEDVELSTYTQVLYVADRRAAGEMSGAREAPFTTLAAALEAAGSPAAEARCAILVAAGRYAESNLKMKQRVDLFGGYDQQNWSRDIFAHETVIDAAQRGPVLFGADDARLDGFVVTGGRHQGPGGGIVCDHVSPLISNNVITANGTIEPEGFAHDLQHQIGNDGGGLALLRGCKAVVRNNLIARNTTGAGCGGGIFVRIESQPTILRNVFVENQTALSEEPGKEGTRSSNGGGIAVSMNCRPTIEGNVIVLNRVAGNSDGGGVYLEYDAHAQMRGNWLVGNFGQDDGGGLYSMKNSQPLLEYNIFAGNRNTSNGSGGIRLSKEGRLVARHNLFLFNPCTIDFVHSWMDFDHNTMVGSSSGAINYENQSPHLMPSIIRGNILWNDAGPEVNLKLCVTGPPDVSGNLIKGGFEGAGNVTVDPQFVDDSRKGTYQTGAFDARRMVTPITLDLASVPAGDELSGRPIRLGEQWTVIRSMEGNQISVFGEITAGQGECFIPGTYRTAPDSPAAAYGAYAPPEPKS